MKGKVRLKNLLFYFRCNFICLKKWNVLSDVSIRSVVKLQTVSKYRLLTGLFKEANGIRK